MTMKTIGIEAFLRWVYRDELPKEAAPAMEISTSAYGGGWDAVSRQGELMADMVSDGRPNCYGVLPLGAWYGAPAHVDALTAHKVVGKLKEVEVPEGWAPLAGLGLTDDEATDAVRRAMPRIASPDGRLRCKPAELVRRYAVLGGTPCWEAETPKRRLVTVSNKPAWFRIVEVTNYLGRVELREVDGFNLRNRRPYPDAYRKTVLEPDPMLAAIERAEYEVWHAALCLLVEVLNEPGVLTAHHLTSPVAPMRPWENCERVSEIA
jgi:hypothetical protein